MFWVSAFGLGVAATVTVLTEFPRQSAEAQVGGKLVAETKLAKNPRLDPKVNDQVESVATKAKKAEGGSLVSALVRAEPLPKKERGAFASRDLDPGVSPGRVWDVAQSDQETPRIELIGEDADSTIKPGETISLRVEVTSYAPVTFTSMDGGAFQNKLPSVTVYADKRGRATARFTATDGTTGPVAILAGCPETSGHIDFVVTIVE